MLDNAKTAINKSEKGGDKADFIAKMQLRRFLGMRRA